MKFEINLSAKHLNATPKAKTMLQVYCDMMNESNEILMSENLHRILYAMNGV